MTAWVQAENQREAIAKAENGDYDDATAVEFDPHAARFSVKARRDPGYRPLEPWEVM